MSSKKSYWFDKKKGKIGTDFRSKHTLLLIYTWMVHKRLLKMGEKGQDVQECMFDELWEDTSGRIRALGVGELSVNKRLSEVQGYSFKFCIELDDAITRNTEEERIDEIAGFERDLISFRHFVLLHLISIPLRYGCDCLSFM